MQAQVRTQAINIDVTPAGPATISVTTSADPNRDGRLELFWSMVHKLVFAEDRSLERKGAVLRRYARAVGRRGDAEFADYANRLAGSYAEVTEAIAHW
jgi:hypothetical protein